MNFFNPKRMLVSATAAVALIGVAQATDISGAGATFPTPIYSKWADAYKKQTGVGMNYQSIGLRWRHQTDQGGRRSPSAPPTCRSSPRK